MSATLIVPCYNEGERLHDDAFLSLLTCFVDLRLLFVNDGSKDLTQERLDLLSTKAPARISILRLDDNHGKAEAVRQGLLCALTEGADEVGYVDADLATPVQEVRRLFGILRDSGAAVVMGSRIVLLGRKVERHPVRHLLGRLFSITGSMILGQRIYDTQCGAKFFRCTPALKAALGKPFLSRWAFDVELLGRLLIGSPGTAPVAATDLREEPLLAWRDVPGSKLRVQHMVRALCDLARIAADLRQRRAVGQQRPSSGSC
jgi:glycosyltransferase involved in cell wall biosynthesis